MSTFSSFAGDGGDMLGGFRSRSTGAKEKIEVSPIMEEEEELVVAAAAAAQVAVATAVGGGGGDGNIGRLGRKLPQAAPDWSSLPEPAIHHILMGMRPSLRDVFSFAGVCKAWRSVFTDWKRELFSSLPPLLVDSGYSPEGLGCFYGLIEQHSLGRKQPIPLALVRPPGAPLDLSGSRVIGVSHGYWILTAAVRKNSKKRRPAVFLLDPLFPKQSHILLPPCPSNFPGPGEVKHFALMTAPPTSPDCVVVVARTRSIWYCRLGDAEWVRHKLAHVFEWKVGELRPVAVFGGQLYALVSTRKVVVVDLLFPRPRVTVIDVEGFIMHSYGGELQGHLVEADGEILYIADKGYERAWPPVCWHRYIVQRLDVPARRWVALDTLGKRSIFLPRLWRGTPLTCVGAAEWGCREDCIYSSCGRSGTTIVVWSMKDGSVVEHHPLPEQRRRFCEWLVPSFCYT